MDGLIKEKMAGSYFIWEKDFGNPGMQHKKDERSNIPFGKRFQACEGDMHHTISISDLMFRLVRRAGKSLR